MEVINVEPPLFCEDGRLHAQEPCDRIRPIAYVVAAVGLGWVGHRAYVVIGERCPVDSPDGFCVWWPMGELCVGLHGGQTAQEHQKYTREKYFSFHKRLCSLSDTHRTRESILPLHGAERKSRQKVLW